MTGAAVPIRDFEAVALQLQTNGELSVAANAGAPILASYDQEGELAVLLFEYQAADPHTATVLGPVSTAAGTSSRDPVMWQQSWSMAGRYIKSWCPGMGG